MNQFLRAALLIAFPVALFSGYQVTFAKTGPANMVVAGATSPLGDLSAMSAIIADVQKISDTGDFVAAEKRVTDFETMWDDNQEKLRPLSKDAWGTIDDASDAALKALRSKAPVAEKVKSALVALAAALANGGMADSGQTGAAGGVLKIAGIDVTDEKGRAIPCEDLIKGLRGAIDGGKISAANKDAADGFMAKALERCNADDDAHADENSARGLALAGK
jgi:hypothetical protein